MNNEDRAAAYHRQNGGEFLTPAQLRRISQKANNPNRTLRRHAHADVKKADARTRQSIRMVVGLLRAGIRVVSTPPTQPETGAYTDESSS